MSGYEMRQVADLSQVLQLIKGFPTSRTADHGAIPVKSIAVLRNGEASSLSIDLDQVEEGQVRLAEIGDVLVAVEGGTVGESIIVTERMVGFVASQQAMTLRAAKHGPLDPWFLAAWMRSDQGRASLSRLVKGSGIQRIAYRDLLTLELPVPPLSDQRRIGQLFRTFTESTEAHKQIVSDLVQLQRVEVEASIAAVIPFLASSKVSAARTRKSR